MQDQVNHYDFLGLSPAAPDQLIEAAVWRLVDRATALAHTSPQRSDALWERIRLIRQDLLSGEETRRAYNASLVKAQDIAIEGVDGDARDDAEEADPAIAGRSESGRRLWQGWRGPRGIVQHSLDAVVGVTVMAIVAVLFLHPWSSSSGGSHVALALSSDGARHGTAYKSDQRVTLKWSAVPKAVVYRLQVASAPSIQPPRIPLSQPLYSGLTTRTSQRVKVIGAQFYYWRVQVNVAGRWYPYSAPNLFAVARPNVGSPGLMRPRNGVVRRPGPTSFCWRGVAGASGYLLQVSGRRQISTISSCRTLDLKPGRYQWKVVSLVRGVQVYRGGVSARAHLEVRRPKSRPTASRSAPASRSEPASPPAIAGPPQSNTVINSTNVVPAVVVTRPAHASSTSARSATTRRVPPPPPPPPVSSSLKYSPLRGAVRLSSSARLVPPPPPPVP